MDPAPASPPPVLKVPLHPALLLGVFLGLGAGLRSLHRRPLGLPEAWLQTLPGAVLLLAFALAGWAFWTFRRQGTSPEFGEPVQRLLRTGPYRFSRNPLFIVNVLLYAGFALQLDSLWACCLLPGLVLALDRLVVTREERFLAARFGEAYAEYRRQVRRWL